MSDLPVPGTPARRFADDMTAQGAPVTAEPGRLLFNVLVVAGPLAGQVVTTGVSLAEVQNWPQVPPHWIHLPAAVNFTATNSDTTDCPPDWLRHSRDFALTDTSVPPALAWLRHVRGVLSSAIATAA